MGASPDVLAQLGFRDQLSGMLDQIPQHCQGPATQGNDLVATPQAAMRRIQTEGIKDDDVLLHHETSGRHHLEQDRTRIERLGTTSPRPLNAQAMFLNGDSTIYS